MVIGVCGFGYTGSGAVIDYLKEFDENEVLDGIEFVLPYFPDGLADLDYHLNSGSLRCGSTVSITRFRKLANYQLAKITNGQIKDLVEEYINSLIHARWIGHCASDLVLYNSWLYRNIGCRLLKHRVFRWLGKLGIYPNCFPARMMEYSANPIGFDKKSAKFVQGVLNCIRRNRDKNLVLDQPFAGNNPVKSFKYFKNPRAIVVDRDPRDVYLFTNKVLRHKGRFMPTNTVKEFVGYFRHMREGMPYKEPDPNVMVISFEDMIYNYDNITARIAKFLGLDVHSRPQSVFDPRLSINNTQLFLRFPEYEKDISYITRELSEYIYKFENYPYLKPTNIGAMFDSNPKEHTG